MKKLLQIALALVLVGSAAPAFAKEKKCKAYVDGDWETIGFTHTDGGCAVMAKKHVGKKICVAGMKKFNYKYMYEGDISHKDGWCSNVD